MHDCVCASVHACEWIGAPAYSAFEKSEGRCCWIGRLCMTLMNTLIDSHEDRPNCDRLIGVYCALWLDERGHDDGCLPLWQGRRVFSEKCYLLKPVDRNILNRAQIVSSAIYHCVISLFWRVYFYLSTLSVFDCLVSSQCWSSCLKMSAMNHPGGSENLIASSGLCSEF